MALPATAPVVCRACHARVASRWRAGLVARRQAPRDRHLPPPDPSYNGNPERNTDEPPPLFAGADAFRLWRVDAPLPVDSGEREIVTAAPRDNQLLVAFDRVWETLRRLYYSTGPSAARWQALGAIPSAGAVRAG